jgi:hypothetical protein
MLFFPVYNYQTISNDDKLLLLLKTYLAEEMSSIHLQYVGFINISTGVIHKYKYTDVIRGQLGEIVKYLRIILRDTIDTTMRIQEEEVEASEAEEEEDINHSNLRGFGVLGFWGFARGWRIRRTHC